MTPLLRLPIDIARIAVRVGVDTTRWALRQVPGTHPHRPSTHPHRPSSVAESPSGPASATVDAPERRPEPARRTDPPLPPHPGNGNGVGAASSVPTPAPPPVPEPLARADRHVEVEVEEVGSFGPANDVGGGFDVRAPWEGYADMGARDVVERLRGADAATKAAVALFEGMHKRRQTVLAATRV